MPKKHICQIPKKIPQPADVRALGNGYNALIKQGIREEHARRMEHARSK